VAVRPSRYDTFSPTRWWRVRSDAKLLWWEYEKLANYWLHDRWTIAPCGGLKHHPKATSPAAMRRCATHRREPRAGRGSTR
jgi:hypothetical protein